MKISIITCVHNRAATIADAIDSVCAQTYADFEHIIVDAQSNDGTLDIIRARQGHRMLVNSGPDGGIYDALNKGVAQAAGDVIGLVHSDDWLADDRVLERVAAAFEGGADVAYGDLDYVSALNPGAIIRSWKAGAFHPNRLRWGWMPPHPALFIRRDLFAEIGLYDTRYRIAADYDLILRLFSKSGLRVAYIPEVLVKMRAGGASNGSLKQVFRKSVEDYRVLRSNNVGGFATLAAKNLRKIGQFRR